MEEKPFFKSKKWWTAIFAAVTPFVLRELNISLSPEQEQLIISPMIAYIVGQGLADFGKNNVKGPDSNE